MQNPAHEQVMSWERTDVRVIAWGGWRGELYDLFLAVIEQLA